VLEERDAEIGEGDGEAVLLLGGEGDGFSEGGRRGRRRKTYGGEGFEGAGGYWSAGVARGGGGAFFEVLFGAAMKENRIEGRCGLGEGRGGW
jgi:hypothetical protein